MTMEKLTAGAAALGITLSTSQIMQFETYFRELVAGNERDNLTSIIGYEEVQIKHFLDSLTVAAVLDSKKSLSMIDIGTGAGFPGLPLKIVFPELRITLLEATAKKVRFLEHLVAAIGLSNFSILNGRAETVAHQPEYRERFDLVLARAVATLPSLVECALPFCKIGGVFIAMKKGDLLTEIEQSQKAIELMGGQMREVKPVTLKEFDDSRCLVIIDKVIPSPPRYPRRPGMPEKRPILG
jgi:16S rRNA (guanine527-N7)-methyltransferase